jgi:hypothetical protein
MKNLITNLIQWLVFPCLRKSINLVLASNYKLSKRFKISSRKEKVTSSWRDINRLHLQRDSQVKMKELTQLPVRNLSYQSWERKIHICLNQGQIKIQFCLQVFQLNKDKTLQLKVVINWLRCESEICVFMNIFSIPKLWPNQMQEIPLVAWNLNKVLAF